MQYRNGRSSPDGPGTVAHAASPEQRGILREHARQIRFSRERRQKFFDRNLFGEPAWDILLTLYVIDNDQRRLSTRQIADLASQPLTTALRWLDYLDAEGLIRRRPNPFDQRVITIELSDEGRTAIDRYLMMMRGAEMFGPVPTVEADRAYFTLRASQEILAAETAEHPKARAVHYQIAEHYLALASSIEAHRRRTRGARHTRRREHV